jgi:hypothetical protein
MVDMGSGRSSGRKADYSAPASRRSRHRVIARLLQKLDLLDVRKATGVARRDLEDEKLVEHFAGRRFLDRKSVV